MVNNKVFQVFLFYLFFLNIMPHKNSRQKHLKLNFPKIIRHLCNLKSMVRSLMDKHMYHDKHKELDILIINFKSNLPGLKVLLIL